MSSSVYGEVAEMPAAPGTVIFIAVLALITALEFFFSYLQRVANRNDCEEIYAKLKEELMLLGIISFTVFVFESAATEELVNNEWFESFDLAHILILFIAIAFIVQALFLVQYATNTGKRYLLALRTNVSDLLEKFNALSADIEHSNINSPLSIFTGFGDSNEVATLFNNIEFKIVEREFFSIHAGKVPAEFDFAKYVSKLFHTYIAEIGEVSPESWMMLAALVALNLIRIYGIDPVAVESTCGEPEEEGEICAEYFIQYGFVCGIILNIAILSIYLASRSYMNSMIESGLQSSGFNITFDSANPSTGYKEFLLKLKQIEDEMNAQTAASPKRGVAGGKGDSGKAESPNKRMQWKTVAQSVGVVMNLQHNAQEMEESKFESGVPHPDKKTSMKQMMEKQRAEEHEKIHIEELNKSKPFMERMYIGVTEFFTSYFEVEKNPAIDRIYWLEKPFLYFKAIEFSFLLQCFYIAMYLTQLLPLTTHTEYCGLWVVILTLPILFGFFVFRQILTKAVMLHAMNGLHKEVVAKVCDEVIEEETICDEVRDKVKKDMQLNFITPEEEVSFIRRKFNEFDVDGSKSIDHDEFRKLLGTLNAYLTIERFDILWKVIDFDLSGEVTWDEVFVFVFPERKREMKEELKTIDLLREKFVQFFVSNKIPRTDWVQKLKQKFVEFDTDGSESIEKQEFRAILHFFDINMTDKAFHTVFAAIDTDAGGGISWEEFKDLILPEEIESQVVAFGGAKGKEKDAMTANPMQP